MKLTSSCNEESGPPKQSPSKSLTYIPPQPDFLFMIKGIKSHNDDSILKLVKSVWQSNKAQIIIEDIIEAINKDLCPKVRGNIQNFLNSIYLKHLNFKIKGNIDIPCFNIYADGQHILNNEIWIYVTPIFIFSSICTTGLRYCFYRTLLGICRYLDG